MYLSPRFARLPNGAEQLAADALGPRLAVAHDALVGAQDGDAQAIEDGPQLGVAPVQAPPRLAGAVDAADDALALGAVLEVEAQHQMRLAQGAHLLEASVPLLVGNFLADLVVEDEALVL